MAHSGSESGVSLIDALIGIAIFGLIAPIMIEVLFASRHMETSERSHRQALTSGHSIIADIGRRYPLKEGSYEGSMPGERQLKWQLKISKIPIARFERLYVHYRVDLNLPWAVGTTVRSTSLQTSVLKKRL